MIGSGLLEVLVKVSNCVFAGLFCYALAAGAVPPVARAQGKASGPEYLGQIQKYEKGDRAAAYDVGLAYYHGISGAPLNYRKAQEWFAKAAGNGDLYAAVKLADMYASGQGIPVNRPEALKWYAKAAGAGNPEAQEKLGDMYYSGEMGKRYYAEAAKWYRKASENELSPGPFAKLGRIYTLGDGVKVDYPEALKWYLKADELGDKTAAACIADIYRSGMGMKKDPAKSYEWLLKGSLKGDAIAMRKLAEAYASGEGVNRNYAEAYKWLAVVTAKVNDASAEQLQAQVSKKLSVGELAGAKKQASALVNKYVTAKDRERKEYEKNLKGR